MFARDVGRLEKLKQTLHEAVRWIIVVLAFGIAGCILVRILHLVLPESWLWLDEPRIEEIDHLLLSGALGALLSRYISVAIPTRRNP
jgi:hypothetical protein